MLYIPHPFKYCHACNQYKPFSQFPKNRSKKDGLSTECHSCNRLRTSRWAETHPDQVAEGKKRWAKANPEKRKASCLLWDEKNPEKLRAISRRRYWKNPEKSRKTARAFYQRHKLKLRVQAKEYQRKRSEMYPRWETMHPERSKLLVQRRTARKRSLPDTMTHENWSHALEYFNHRCAICNRPRGLWHTLAMDHWIPLSVPDCPGTIPTNIIPLCHGVDGCNNSKHNSDPVEWLTEKFGPRKAQKILKRIQEYFEWVKDKD